MYDLGKCSKCGMSIFFVRMKSGKMMPCDPGKRNYTDGGKERIVLLSGRVVSGTFTDGEGDGFGYTSHFATCPYAANFRK